MAVICVLGRIGYTRRAKECNATMEFYWKPFLVESNNVRILKVDTVAKHAKSTPADPKNKQEQMTKYSTLLPEKGCVFNLFRQRVTPFSAAIHLPLRFCFSGTSTEGSIPRFDGWFPVSYRSTFR